MPVVHAATPLLTHQPRTLLTPNFVAKLLEAHKLLLRVRRSHDHSRFTLAFLDTSVNMTIAKKTVVLVGGYRNR